MSDRARPSAPGPGLPVGPGDRPRTSAGLPWPRITVVTPCYQAGRQSPFAVYLPQIDAAIATYTAGGTTDALIAEHANR